MIYEQVINKKGTGNFKTTNDKGYFITTRKPKQIYERANYQFGNLIYDPRVITIGTGALTIGVDMFNDSTVPETKTGIIFNTIRNLDDINKNMEMVWKKVRE